VVLKADILCHTFATRSVQDSKLSHKEAITVRETLALHLKTITIMKIN